MQTFFTGPPCQGRVQLAEPDAQHLIKVLRARPEDRVAVAFGGGRFLAALQIEGGAVYGHLLEALPDSEPRLKVTLYQGLPKGDKMDLIVQKGTELGLNRIVPCLFSRSVGRWEGGDRKLQRWQRIAQEAAVQSGRGLVPAVDDCLDFSALCSALPLHEQALVAWEGGGKPLGRIYQGAQDLALVIGPEGGISGDEMAALPAQALTLGPRILRTETAGIAALAMLMMLSGDVG
ncbi:MAG: 16S rRNA (uracil(1498)-N(3))-methyltransferase [Christensenellales bacterium]